MGGVSPPPLMATRTYRVETPILGSTEGWLVVGGVEHGPFPSPEAADAFLVRLVEEWDRRARELGGRCRRLHYLEVEVELPDGVPLDGPDRPWPASA